MDKQEVIKILDEHNKWRRGDDNYAMCEPKILGEAIEWAINYLKGNTMNDKDLVSIIKRASAVLDEADKKNNIPNKGNWNIEFIPIEGTAFLKQEPPAVRIVMESE